MGEDGPGTTGATPSSDDSAPGDPAEAAPVALSARRRAALAGLGFLAVTAVAAPVTLASGSAPADARPTPTASPLPTGFDVALTGTATSESADTVSVTLQNKGAAFRALSVRVEGPGYERAEVFGLPGLGAGDLGQATVSLRPTCGAGVGVPRRPELVLDVRGHDGTAGTLRLDLTDAVPPLLGGACTAPLGTGARLAVSPLPVDELGNLRLRVTLTAGPGLLWVGSIDAAPGLIFEGLDGLPQVVAPGGTKVLDLTLRLESCVDLARTGDPLALALRVRAEPPAEARLVTFASLGGEPYRRAVAATLARLCP